MRRKYRFEDLSDDEFANLANRICMDILGMGVISFAPGKDGGRDGKFSGTAKSYPSPASPWSGNFIIQAKWTGNAAASTSDPEFVKIVETEIKKIKALVANDELDNYIIFTNRRKPAIKLQAHLKKIKKAGAKNCEILGCEELVKFLDASGKIWSEMGFDKFEAPFTLQPNDLEEVVIAFSGAIKTLPASPAKAEKSATDLAHAKFDKKNSLNGLSKDYAEYIVEESWPSFDAIRSFLNDPRHVSLKDLYHDAADELKQKISAHRASFDSFDHIFIFLSDLILGKDATLKGKKRYVRTFLHYMYHDCDIGKHA